jgi:tRNA-Thr(GGU) m(6)t(6)A37 methyltransferase TsaA
MSAQLVYKQIGIIRSPHTEPEKTPIQPVFAAGHAGTVEVFPQYREGLAGLGEFTHIFLLYHLHLIYRTSLTVVPFMGDHATGVFSTRHPERPNPIGISLVRLVKIDGLVLHVDNIDVIDCAPLIDIKPFVPRFDSVSEARGGWTESVDSDTAFRRGSRTEKEK